MNILVLATTNQGKISELREIITHHPDAASIRVMPPTELGFKLPEIFETGETFAQNASLKARAGCQLTGHPALADDSGLCVDVLNGRPGVQSARWTGPNATDSDRNEALLELLRDVPLDQRTARFVCVVTVAFPGGKEIAAEGICEGVITKSPQGENGFGYDPIFFIPEFQATLAQLSPEQKNQISHRRQALDHLVSTLMTQRIVLGNDL